MVSKSSTVRPAEASLTFWTYYAGVVMPAETKQVPGLQHLAQQYAAEMVILQPTGPHLLIGSGFGSSLVATAVAHALTTLGYKPLLVSATLRGLPWLSSRMQVSVLWYHP